MRILCLHGVGSSASICEAQFRPLIQAADPSYEFLFVDGPVPSDRGPGMAAFVDGPFYSHTRGYEAQSMAVAIGHLESVMDEAGPFDGALGFSQGAALLIAYLHRCQVLGEPAAFKFALFFSSVLPCSADVDFGNKSMERICPLGEEGNAGEKARFRDLLEKTVVPAHKNHSLLPSFDTDVYWAKAGPETPRLMHSMLTDTRIRIPSVHVAGAKDAAFMRSMAEVAYGLCDEKHSKKLEHSGSHQPPQRNIEVKSAIRAMEWAIRRAF